VVHYGGPAVVHITGPGTYSVGYAGTAARSTTWKTLEEDLGLIKVTHHPQMGPIAVELSDRGRLVAAAAPRRTT
jgi:hypothetical protein